MDAFLKDLFKWVPIHFCKPPAACLGHSDEDDEEEAHSPDACYRQHHCRQYAWNKCQRDNSGIHIKYSGNIWLPLMPGKQREGLTAVTPWSCRGRSMTAVTNKEELTGLRYVWHFNLDGSIWQEALGGVCSHRFSLTDWITVLWRKQKQTNILDIGLHIFRWSSLTVSLMSYNLLKLQLMT